MSRLDLSPFPRVESPLAPLGQFAHWVAWVGIELTVGLLIGAIVARVLRAKHLHWSWPALAAILVGVLHAPLGSLTPALACIALTATRRSRRWHKEDLEAGADLAEVARRRSAPIDLLRSAANAIVLRRLRGGKAHGWFRGEELVLGRDERGRFVSVPFAPQRGGTHALLVGATGSGKTVTQTWMAVQAIERGMGVVVIDPKGDRAMRAAIDRAARIAGKSFVEWTPDGPCVYNPFARGGVSEIADKALAGERFTEPHYLRQAQRFLGHVVRSLHGAGIEASLQAIAHHLDPARLEMLARSLDEERAEVTHAYLDSLTPRQRTDIAGVRDRLAILAESDVGRWLDPSTDAAEQFDLLDAVRARAVVYFRLDADSRPLLAQMLGAAIVQDLQTTVSSLQGCPIPTAVVIDEFASLAAEHVVRLFGRARSAGVSLVLSTQELADLRLPGREALLEQVMGNLTVLIAHRQVVPASAELIAGLAGTKGVWKTSRRGDGQTTRTRAREGLLRAGEVTGLGPGWAAVFVLSEGGSARVARVFSAD
jgi:type IV secretory pathway TraG/TraD family ATPase VirD4